MANRRGSGLVTTESSAVQKALKKKVQEVSVTPSVNPLLDYAKAQEAKYAAEDAATAAEGGINQADKRLTGIYGDATVSTQQPRANANSGATPNPNAAPAPGGSVTPPPPNPPPPLPQTGAGGGIAVGADLGAGGTFQGNEPVQVIPTIPSPVTPDIVKSNNTLWQDQRELNNTAPSGPTGSIQSGTNNPLYTQNQNTVQSAHQVNGFSPEIVAALARNLGRNALGATEFANAQTPEVSSLLRNQDAVQRTQQDLAVKLGQQAEQTAANQVAQLQNPNFTQPNVATAFGTKEVAGRAPTDLQNAIQATLLQYMNQDPTQSASYIAQKQALDFNRTQNLDLLARQLQATGNLRGSGGGREALASFYGQDQIANSALLASADQQKQAALSQALGYDTTQQGLNLQEAQMVGNLRGTPTLEAQQSQAAVQMALANMFNQNQQFGANYNLQKAQVGQDIANQTLNRLLTQTSPTQREIFSQGQTTDLMNYGQQQQELDRQNKLAQANLLGTLDGQSTLAGKQINQQVNQQGMLFPEQLNAARLANQGTYQNVIQQQELFPGQLTTQQLQNAGLGIGNQQASQALALAQALQPNQVRAAGSGADLAQQQALQAALQTQFMPTSLQQQQALSAQQITAADQANEITRLQRQFLPAQLRGQEALQNQQLQMGNQQITGADLANQAQRLQNESLPAQLAAQLGITEAQLQAMTTQNQFLPRSLENQQALQGQQITMGGQQIYGNTLQNQLAEAMQSRQLRSVDLANEAAYGQNRLSSEALTSAILQNQFLPESLRNQQALQGQQVTLGGQQIYSNTLANQLQEGMNPRLLRQAELENANLAQQGQGMGLQNDFQRLQNQYLPQTLENQQALQGQQITLGGQNIYANTLQNRLAEAMNPRLLRQTDLQTDSMYQQNQQNAAMNPLLLQALGLSNAGQQQQNLLAAALAPYQTDSARLGVEDQQQQMLGNRLAQLLSVGDDALLKGDPNAQNRAAIREQLLKLLNLGG